MKFRFVHEDQTVAHHVRGHMNSQLTSLTDDRKKVLTVDDDRLFLATLEYILVAAGYDVLTANDGATSLEIARSNDLDLIILDLNVPVIGGIQVCRALRDDGNAVPILILTATKGVNQCVEGLDCGADDYMNKPFEMPELMARVQAQLRRAEMIQPRKQEAQNNHDHTLTVGDLSVDFAKRKAYKGDFPISLRPRELDILNCLASRRGRAVSRGQILSDVWGDEFGGGARTVDVHVSMLRRKIEDDHTDPKMIITVHGTGYRLNS